MKVVDLISKNSSTNTTVQDSEENAVDTNTTVQDSEIESKFSDYSSEFKSMYNFNEVMSLSGNNVKWRIILWKDIIKKSMQKPILGYGFGMLYNNETLKNMGWGYGDDVGFLDPHNSYLSILYRTGIVGLLIFLLFIISFFIKMIKFLRGCQDLAISVYMISVLSAIIFILVISFFMVVLEGPFLGIFLWVFIGLALSLANIYDTKLKSLEN